ncbi:MAG TPA: DUF6295 family protein [Acidimicrobiales bacterium]
MCTYQTETLRLRASAKTPRGWVSMTDASVYFDHPVHFSATHALMIDVLNTSSGGVERVGLEMDAVSARNLAETILRALDNAPASLLDDSVV